MVHVTHSLLGHFFSSSTTISITKNQNFTSTCFDYKVTPLPATAKEEKQSGQSMALLSYR